MKRLAVILAILFLSGIPAYAAPVSSPCTQTGPGATRCDPVNTANPLPVTIVSGGGGAGDASAANQTLQITQETAINTVLGLQANSTWDGSAAATLMSISRYQGVKLEAIRALLAAPLAVTGTFFQATQPISAAALPLPSGAATSALQSTMNTTLGSPFQAGGSIGNTAFGATQSGTWNINNVSGTVSLPAGAATSALQSTINTTLGSPLQAGGTVVVTGVATAANQSTMATNQTAVQAPVAPGAATATKAELVGGQYNSAVQAFTNGQQGSLQFDQRGGLLVQDGQVIPSVSVTSAATLFTVADTSGYGTISVQVTSAGTSCTITYESSEDGTTWSSVVGYTPASNQGTGGITSTTAIGQALFPIASKQFRARVSTYTSGTVTIQGTLRKDALAPRAMLIAGGLTDGGNVGGNNVSTLYEGRTTNKTAVTTGQYVRPIATSIGAAVNKPFQVPELDWSYPAAAGGISNTTTAVTMVGAAGAGIRNYMTAIQLSAPTLGAATEVAVRDGAGGTVLWRGFMSTAGGNQSANLSSPIKSTANTLLEVVTLTATVTGAIYVNAQGYQAP